MSERHELRNDYGFDVTFDGLLIGTVHSATAFVQLFQTDGGRYVAYEQDQYAGETSHTINVFESIPEMLDKIQYGPLAKDLLRSAGLPYTRHIG